MSLSLLTLIVPDQFVLFLGTGQQKNPAGFVLWEFSEAFP